MAEQKNFKELNHFVGMGRLGSDPVYTQKGEQKVAKFALAINNGTDKPDWLDVVAFGGTAEFASNHLEQGVKVVIEGRIATSTYEKDGVKRKSVNIVARNISFAESKRSVEGSAEVEAENTGAATEEEAKKVEEDFSIPEELIPTDDDTPFK